jgi:hypothetical protein
VTPKNIKDAMKLEFNNPIAAMMIAPVRPRTGGAAGLSRNEATNTIVKTKPPLERAVSQSYAVPLNQSSKYMSHTMSADPNKSGWGSYSSNHDRRKQVAMNSVSATAAAKKAKPQTVCLTQYPSDRRRGSTDPVPKWLDIDKSSIVVNTTTHVVNKDSTAAAGGTKVVRMVKKMVGKAVPLAGQARYQKIE